MRVAGAVGGGCARLVLAAVRASRFAPALERTNYRGRTVSLAGGPALAIAAAAASALSARTLPGAAAALTAGLGAGAVGLYDDISGEKGTKGFRGHLAALREGRVTSGLVKIVGVGAAGLVASALLSSGQTRRRPLDVLLGAGVIAGTANLVNLFDLRPGRAAKVGLLLGTVAGPRAAGTVGATAALLPADLGEEIMLGDCGANALGALVGLALAARTGPIGRAGLLAGIAALTVASERVSFTEVIARTPVLRKLDELGRDTVPGDDVGSGRAAAPSDLRTGSGRDAVPRDVTAAGRDAGPSRPAGARPDPNAGRTDPAAGRPDTPA